jgi:hypothetical protein
MSRNTFRAIAKDSISLATNTTASPLHTSGVCYV